ncbi:MAG: TIGR00296 family protein [Thermoplasmatales archaeon]|nr:TIGR00296 family protein [Thermoplasmatales archaeon]
MAGLGETAVRYARASAKAAILGGKKPTMKLPPEFSENRGVFVTIKDYPSGELLGCIGYPEPTHPLAEALAGSAVSAALEDPRFPPLTKDTVEWATFEVTILSKPEPFDVPNADLPKVVEVGRHGLILSFGGARGLLLPQVPTEQGWDVLEYLEGLSRKTGLGKDAWKDPGAKISWFTGEIYAEIDPNGRVERL